MHCEKLSTSQIVFFSNTNLNAKYTMFSSRNRRNCDCKDFPLKFFHKKAFPWQFDKIKRKFLFAHRLFFNENKMILAHRALNFFPCNAKQEVNLTLPTGAFLRKYSKVPNKRPPPPSPAYLFFKKKKIRPPCLLIFGLLSLAPKKFWTV